MRLLLCCTALALCHPMRGQYDLGVSVGVCRHSLWGKRSEGHGGTSFNHVRDPELTAAMFYRERIGTHVDLGLEAQLSRRRFAVHSSSGGLAGSQGLDAEVDLWLAHLSITPEVRMNSKASVVVRFGPQIGFKLGGRMTGYRWSSWPYGSSREDFVNASPDAFWGDIRFLFGLGFRASPDKVAGLTVDPYVSAALTSMLKERPGSRGTEVGLRIGIAIRRRGGTFTQWLEGLIPTPAPAGSHW